VNLLVLRAGQHTAREIALTLERLRRSGVKVTGAVLNDARSLRGRYGRYGHYYRYEYRTDERA
jgi:Mrp family chromosome partitioning ATPase